MQRRAIAVRGIVQGVGFRPFVYGLASRLRLSGFVTNTHRGVLIEIEGDSPSIERFERELTSSTPPLARLESVSSRTIAPQGGAGFRIEPSGAGGEREIFVCPDVATCDACLFELRDPSNRRYRYPFINCTACGPRLTIVTGSPYDRERTTMAGFAMCGACRAEYEDPNDRRFHAEPIACAVCGPRVTATEGSGAPVAGEPVAAAAQALRDGRIVAIKGLGGFHLACDAASDEAVVELRRRKHRDEKPFALLVADLAAARLLCEVPEAEAAVLGSVQRPIVILRRAAGAAVAPSIAPGSGRLGLMLPYTPLHHLLLDAVGGQPLVMTSGNAADEPIAIDNEDALDRLAGIADLFLLHDRSIHVRCDDSVMHVNGGAPETIRRSRGYAPAPVSLPFECLAPILAVGGQMKNTFALARGHDAFVSHHIGDLGEFSAVQAFSRDLALYEQLFAMSPAVVAHDLHPDYASTALAASRPATVRIGVQHHHAHVASCMAEHGLTGEVIGVAWDGAGFGTDGAVWGGEFFVGGYSDVSRAAHLRYVAMPGGDRAATQPWRMAFAHQHDAGVDSEAQMLETVGAVERGAVGRMIGRRINAPLTSSAGRLFDAVACLCGLHERTSFEGQAAMALEQLAESSPDRGAYPYDILDSDPLVIDTRPMIRAVVVERAARVARATIARRFHTTLAEIVAAVCLRLRERTGLARVALSGGVFLNRILAEEVQFRLAGLDFEVYRHRLVPPGDGGLSLGQLAVAAARLTDGSELPVSSLQFPARLPGF